MTDQISPSSESAARGASAQIRGSSLLLLGRVLSKFVNFAIQVAIVRMLTKEDFGAFAYGLALVLAGELVVKLGLGRGASRFVPRYFEGKQNDLLLGTLALVTGAIVIVGAAAYAALTLLASTGWPGIPEGRGGEIVLILAVLAPVQALDALCIQTLACVSTPRAILFRKHVIGPSLRLGAIAIAYISGGSPVVLAWAYLAGGVLGLAIALQLTLRELHARGVLPLAPSAWRVDWRALLAFSIPLVSHDLVFITSTAVSSVVLMLTGTEQDVAAMRAVVPAGMLILIVSQSFTLLFMPSATRSHERHGIEALRDHHWQSAAWVAILSFPLFAATFCVAPDVVPLVFGSAYADSAAVLAILAVGHYVVVCLSFNRETLQLLGRVAPIFWINLLTIGLTLLAAFLLSPHHGALGAAIALTGGRCFAALARHWVLTRGQALGEPPRHQRMLWLKVAGATAVASAIGWGWQPALPWQLLGIVVVSLLLLRSTSRALDIRQTFPELLRVPLVSRLVAP